MIYYTSALLSTFIGRDGVTPLSPMILFLQCLLMTHALPMVTFVLLGEPTTAIVSMRVDWRSVTIDSGGPSVMTCGAVRMLE